MFKRELMMNKIVGLVLLGLGAVWLPVEGDATALMMMGILSLPLFAARENVIK